MPKDEWGVKRVCPECQNRFYDLGNDPMTCPSCGATMTVESFSSDKSRVEKTQAAAPKPAAEDELETGDVLDDDDIEDVDDELLETDDEDENVSLEEIADVSNEDEES